MVNGIREIQGCGESGKCLFGTRHNLFYRFGINVALTALISRYRVFPVVMSVVALSYEYKSQGIFTYTLVSLSPTPLRLSVSP